MSLSVHYNVSTALVRWATARGARSYSVHAVTDQGLTDACNTTHTSCFLHGLQCSQIYNVTVKAHNMACNDSVTSEPYRLITGTNPPTGTIFTGCMCVTLFPLSSTKRVCPPLPSRTVPTHRR